MICSSKAGSRRLDLLAPTNHPGPNMSAGANTPRGLGLNDANMQAQTGCEVPTLEVVGPVSALRLRTHSPRPFGWPKKTRESERRETLVKAAREALSIKA